MGTLTFGLVMGCTITALPFLLSKAGVTVDRIATISAVALSPSFWAFLVTPVIDVGLTRRTYAFLLASAAAVCLGAAFQVLSPNRLPLFTALVLLASLAVVLQSSAVSGWVTEFIEDGQRGRVGGWTNAANLGGGAAGAMLVMWSAKWLEAPALGLMIAAAAVLSSLILIGFPAPARPQFKLRQIFGGTFRSVVENSRQPQVRIGFLIFLAPASCAAASNLFGGLGNEFHASSQRVVWTTGAGTAIASAAGSIFGGSVADRMDRAVLYLGGGILVALSALWIALSPQTQVTFTTGVLAYGLFSGICYAAFSALSYQLVGKGNPAAATQLGLFAAASNAAISYMTWFDGQGFRLFGVRGLFLVDGLAAIGAGVPLLIFLRGYLARTRDFVEASGIVPEEA
jgi:MFS family permease